MAVDGGSLVAKAFFGGDVVIFYGKETMQPFRVPDLRHKVSKLNTIVVPDSGSSEAQEDRAQSGRLPTLHFPHAPTVGQSRSASSHSPRVGIAD